MISDPDQGGTCVIVGASHAGVQLAASLRKEGWKGPCVILGEEPVLPYHKPPLSKAFLNAARGHADILLKSPAAYDALDVGLQLGCKVVRIDTEATCVILQDGTSLHYDRLALATGARARIPDLPGIDLPGVYTLRSLVDGDAIREATGLARYCVVIGGGFIGLEMAASLRKQGLAVTVLEAGSRILARTNAPEVSEYFQRLHRRKGSLIHTNVAVVSVEGEHRVEAVVDGNGVRYPADMVVVGVGVIANSELAAAAGLDVENGILVDTRMRTSHPNIVAIGDCAAVRRGNGIAPLRIESVQNAVDQAKTAAITLCGGSTPYTALPWFWSDQFDTKLQIAGLCSGYDTVMFRGNPEADEHFSAWYYRDQALLAVDAINDPQTYVLARKILEAGVSVPPEAAGDKNSNLKTFLAMGAPA